MIPEVLDQTQNLVSTFQNFFESSLTLRTNKMGPRPNSINLFTAAIYEFCNKLVFVLDKPFQTRLMPVGKAGAYPILEQLKFTHLGRLLTFPTKIRLGWKGHVRDEHSSLLPKLRP
jgi:hypothetical protein